MKNLIAACMVILVMGCGAQLKKQPAAAESVKSSQAATYAAALRLMADYRVRILDHLTRSSDIAAFQYAMDVEVHRIADQFTALLEKESRRLQAETERGNGAVEGGQQPPGAGSLPQNGDITAADENILHLIADYREMVSSHLKRHRGDQTALKEATKRDIDETLVAFLTIIRTETNRLVMEKFQG